MQEKSKLIWLILSVYVVLIAGIVLGYFVVLPMVLDAILRFGSSSVAPMWALSSYCNTALGILLVSALLLELPVVMTHLSAWGWVESQTWKKGRRLAIVINAIVSGILSPPDLLSMILMMIPVQILYECGIFFASVAQWWGHGKKAASS